MINYNLNSVRALIVLLFLSISMTATAEEDLASLMEDRLQNLLSVISGEHTQADVDAVLNDTIDYAAITKGVLGKHGKTLSAEHTSRFQGEFEQSVNSLLEGVLSSLGEFDLKIGEVKRPKEGRAQVYAVVTTQDSERFEIISSIGKTDEKWLVRNLIVNGVNLGLTYRNQFNELVNKQGDAVKAIDVWGETINDALDEVAG